MSYRRSLSFADNEEYLLQEFDNNGKSTFAKEAMKFFLRYRDKMVISTNNYTPQNNIDVKNKISKLLKK